MNPPARPQRDPIRVEASAGLRNPLAALSVLVVVLAGCVGVAPTAEEPGPEARLEPAPASFEPIGPDAPGLSVETGDRTLYRFSTEDLEFEEETVAFAFRAKEPLEYGIWSDRSARIEEFPSDGWMSWSAVVARMPVDAIWGNASPSSRYTFTERGAAWHPIIQMIWASQSNVQVHTKVEDRTVVSVSEERPVLLPINVGGTTGSLTPEHELDRGAWVVVYMGGASPGSNDATRIVHTFNVTGEIEVYRLPDRPLRFGFGFDAADRARVSAQVSGAEATVGASIRQETRRTSLLYVNSFDEGSGQARVVFPGHDRSLQPADDPAGWFLSAPNASTIGFDVEQWTGEPNWFLTDAWLPPPW